MDIEIITIGNEILCGRVVDTNFNFLASSLFKEGFLVTRSSSVRDDKEAILDALGDALDRCDLVIITGGLGPTIDDVTKEAVASFFGSEFVFDERIKEDLEKRFGKDLSSIKNQATVPKDAKILQNDVGTAPGLLFQKDGKSCMVLPGVPNEMKTMAEKKAIPFIQQNFQGKKIFSKEVHLCHLPENAIDPYLRELERFFPDVEMGIYPGYGVLSVEFKLRAGCSEEAEGILQGCIDKVSEEFYGHVYSLSERKIEKAIHDYFTSNSKTLMLAESCTGGALSAKMTAIPGASNYFQGSVVSYSNEIKKLFLDVKNATLRDEGAVSEKVVREMIMGLMKRSEADYGIAITGVAGPDGGTLEKPVGTVWYALMARGEEPVVKKILSRGRAKRHSVIEYSANYALGALWQYIVYDIVPK